MMFFVSDLQITSSVSQLATPIISNGEQCYLVSTRCASFCLTANADILVSLSSKVNLVLCVFVQHK